MKISHITIPTVKLISTGADSASCVAFKKFMIRPIGAKSTEEAMEMETNIYHTLRSLLKKSGYNTTIREDGSFMPLLASTEQTLNFILKAIQNAGYIPSKDVTIAIDVDASKFFIKEKEGVYDYTLFKENNVGKLTSEQQVNYLESLIERYPIDSIEDGMASNDTLGWQMLNERIGKRCHLIGNIPSTPDR